MRRPPWWAVALVAVALAALGVVVLLQGDTADPGASVANRSFRSASGDRPATVWAVGDGDGSAAGAQVVNLIEGARPDRVLYLGDVYDDGTRDDFSSRYEPTYGRLARLTAPTPGNHDWPQHGEGYDPYWRGVTGAAPPPWYAVRVGGWELISLDSEAPHGAGSAQVRWLRSRLAAPGTCRLAFWHRPRTSAGLHGDQPDVEPFAAALRGHATLLVNGHDHDLQRFGPVAGLTQLVSGAGGHGLYPVDRAHPGLAFADDRTYGALRIALRPGRADLAFVAPSGRVLDRSSARCAAA